MAHPTPIKLAARALAGAALALAAVAAPAQAAQHRASSSILVFFDSPRGAFARNFNPFAGSPLQPTVAGIYEPLYIVPYIGTGAGKPVPWLATAYAYSNGLKTLTFTIRQGVKWSDGQPLTAKDVAYTMNLEESNPAVDKVGLSTYKPVIKLVGSDQVSLTYKKADASAFAGLVNNLMIVPQHIWSKIAKPDTYTNPNPVGSGPFTQVQNFSPQSYDVAKNPHYWQKGKPAFDAIRFPSYNGNDSATTDLTAGKIDWAGLFIPQVNQVYDGKNPNFHHYYAGSVPVLLSFNDAKYPFSLPVFRKAISMVLNRQAFSLSAEYGYGPAATLTGLNGQFAPWEDKSIPGIAEAPNVAAAQKMLTQAGFKVSNGELLDPHGMRVAFDINVVQGWTDWDAMTQIIAQNVKALGITATPKPVQFGDYFSRCQLGNFTATMSWSDSGSTPYQFYHDLTSSDTYQPLGKAATGNNWERYHDPAMDALFAQFQQTTDSGKQHALVNQMQRLFVQNLPSIPLIINPVWYEYNTTHFTGFPTKDNPYVNAAPYTTPDRLIVMTRLTPTGQ